MAQPLPDSHLVLKHRRLRLGRQNLDGDDLIVPQPSAHCRESPIPDRLQLKDLKSVSLMSVSLSLDARDINTLTC